MRMLPEPAQRVLGTWRQPPSWSLLLLDVRFVWLNAGPGRGSAARMGAALNARRAGDSANVGRAEAARRACRNMVDVGVDV